MCDRTALLPFEDGPYRTLSVLQGCCGCSPHCCRSLQELGFGSDQGPNRGTKPTLYPSDKSPGQSEYSRNTCFAVAVNFNKALIFTAL